MTAYTALITDLAGERLSADERDFLRDANPYGIILFARNCATPEQVKALVEDAKSALGRDHLPVLIDQEGGRVARLRPPQWRACPAAGKLAALGQQAASAIYLNARLMAAELLAHGITVDCAPVADLPVEGAHDIIGDRAYGATAERVAELADAMARGLADGGVVPIVKHIPGHGRAQADSHLELPVVEASLDELEKTDFAVFKQLTHIPMAMTAHVLYTALDKERIATVSPAAIEYIRTTIGYDGLLMSDDLTMKAMSGSSQQKARDVLSAGCDIVLHCNAPLGERIAVAGACDVMTEQAVKRHERAFAAVKVNAPFDTQEAEIQLAAYMQAGSAVA